MNFIRTRESQSNGINLYRFQNSTLSEEINNAIDEVIRLTNEIIESKSPKEKEESISRNNGRINELRAFLDEHFKTTQPRNIINGTSLNDRKIGSGTDSVVFPLGENFVYKEGKESDERNIEFLRKKYIILRRFLGDIIPRSFFIYGESNEKVEDRGMKKYSRVKKKAMTIQKRVKGLDCRKMSKVDKLDKNFLQELENAHKKYVLLKMLLASLINELGLPRKSLSLQLDLGDISKIDELHTDNTEFIESKIRSPNIMWDGKKISFIDFGFGKWDNDKERIFEVMMSDEVMERWHNLCKSFGLSI